MSAWADIQFAPKDGTLVDLWVKFIKNNELQQIKCTKLLLNEKTDLTLRLYKIIEESDELISILKQEITQKNE